MIISVSCSRRQVLLRSYVWNSQDPLFHHYAVSSSGVFAAYFEYRESFFLLTAWVASRVLNVCLWGDIDSCITGFFFKKKYNRGLKLKGIRDTWSIPRGDTIVKAKIWDLHHQVCLPIVFISFTRPCPLSWPPAYRFPMRPHRKIILSTLWSMFLSMYSPENKASPARYKA